MLLLKKVPLFDMSHIAVSLYNIEVEAFRSQLTDLQIVVRP